jgi:hypothetical protein
MRLLKLLLQALETWEAQVRSQGCGLIQRTTVRGNYLIMGGPTKAYEVAGMPIMLKTQIPDKWIRHHRTNHDTIRLFWGGECVGTPVRAAAMGKKI